MEARAEAEFTDQGMRWQDSRRAAPGVERFVDRIGSFLILVGIAGLAVGGVGVRPLCAPIWTARLPPSPR